MHPVQNIEAKEKTVNDLEQLKAKQTLYEKYF